MRALSETDVRALTVLHVLLRAGRPVPRRSISVRARTPTSYLRSALPKLAKAGFIERHGRQGYTLAKAPGEIRLREILEALDRPERPAAPCGGNFEACPSRAACVLAVLCRKADRSFQEVLREFTLEDLRDASPDLPNCMDPQLAGKEPAGRSSKPRPRKPRR